MVLVNKPVNFEDTSTGNPIIYEWDFGDGKTSTEKLTTHTYTNPGTYSILHKITNEQNESVSCTQTIIVTSEEGVKKESNVIPIVVAGSIALGGLYLLTRKSKTQPT